jgi:hypothetical protein
MDCVAWLLEVHFSKELVNQQIISEFFSVLKVQHRVGSPLIAAKTNVKVPTTLFVGKSRARFPIATVQTKAHVMGQSSVAS